MALFKGGGGGANAAPIHVMPYLMGDNVKGILIINMKAEWQEVTLVGVTSGIATVVEVATDGPSKKKRSIYLECARGH